MQFKFYVATKVLLGKGCVMENRNEFKKCGKRALIVTGRSSGKASGALDDVAGVLSELGIEYSIFDRVENNPTLENVNEGGQAAREFGADFIVGIGGGSPLDASKGIAVLAVNDIEPIELYSGIYENRPIPIIAIPTTAGTGSEVTPYSVLTRPDKQTKVSFSSEYAFPKVAFLDARYTESLPYHVTVNSAVDFLSHAVEGYLSKRSNEMSDVLAEESIGLFGECIQNLLSKKTDFETREKLLYGSMLAGMVISQTGTTLVHVIGHMLTYFKGIPHGEANGLLMEEYLRFNYGHVKEKIDNVIRLLKLNSIDEFGKIINELIPNNLTLSEEEIELLAALSIDKKGMNFNIKSATSDDLTEMLRKLFGRSKT
jgi:alcohol dehydrogenase class IV